MDDFNVGSLHESKNEWGARLLTILTPLIIEGFKSIFEESYKLCKENGETDKYLMTFQNFITRIPKWNPTIIESERKRIIERSGCSYLEELVTCIHIIQLKLLTAMRVGQKQKKIDINIPKLDDFIHKCYINVARKVYKNVYLFELSSHPLQVQKNNRELEIIVQECVLNAVRESIPVESILRAYMDETVEETIVEEIKEEIVPKKVDTEGDGKVEGGRVVEGGVAVEERKVAEPISLLIEPLEEKKALSFNDMDSAMANNGKEEQISAPKSIERLEEISALRNMQRKLEEEDNKTHDDDDMLKISDDFNNDVEFVLDDIEILT